MKLVLLSMRRIYKKPLETFKFYNPLISISPIDGEAGKPISISLLLNRIHYKHYHVIKGWAKKVSQIICIAPSHSRFIPSQPTMVKEFSFFSIYDHQDIFFAIFQVRCQTLLIFEVMLEVNFTREGTQQQSNQSGCGLQYQKKFVSLRRSGVVEGPLQLKPVSF